MKLNNARLQLAREASQTTSKVPPVVIGNTILAHVGQILNRNSQLQLVTFAKFCPFFSCFPVFNCKSLYFKNGESRTSKSRCEHSIVTSFVCLGHHYPRLTSFFASCFRRRFVFHRPITTTASNTPYTSCSPRNTSKTSSCPSLDPSKLSSE